MTNCRLVGKWVGSAIVLFIAVATLLFNGLSVYAAGLFSSDFENGNADGWTIINGVWGVELDGNSHVFKQSSTSGEGKAIAGDSAWDNYTIEMKMKITETGSSPASGMMARYVDDNNYYLYRYHVSQRKLQFYRMIDGNLTLLASTDHVVTTGEWVKLKLILNGNSIKGYADDVEKLNINSSAINAGKIGIRTYGAKTSIDDVLVTDDVTGNVYTLQAPSNLISSVGSASHFDLQWEDNSNNEEGFRIERKKEGSHVWEVVGFVPANHNVFQDGGVLENSAYYHRVYAYSNTGRSDYSNEVSSATGSAYGSDQGIVIAEAPSGERRGESTPIKLNNGNIVVYYGSFTGFSDLARSRIARITSVDGGETWSSEEIVFDGLTEGVSLLHPSIIRASNGNLVLVYSKLVDEFEAYKVSRISIDEGATWTEERRVSASQNISGYDYATGAHDRLIKLSNGRLLNPVHVKMGMFNNSIRLGTDIYISDDHGETWVKTTATPLFTESIGAPEHGFYETSVVELSSNHLLMYGRTAAGWFYESRSSDNGNTWTEPKQTSIRNPLAPAYLKKLTTGELLLVHNSYVNQLLGGNLGQRWILASRISTDGGVTWSNYRQLEYADSIDWYDYPSILLDDGNAHIFYRVQRKGSVHGVHLMYQKLAESWFTTNENETFDAQMPVINQHPTDKSVGVDGPSPTLSVTASVYDGGTLSYQWYSNYTNSTANGSAINGATEATYQPPTTVAGTTYYYVEVTNTNLAAPGVKIAKTTSSVAAVTVNLENDTTASLTGTEWTREGDTYSLTYGLVNASHVLAQEITLQYDSQKFELLNTTPIADHTVVVHTIQINQDTVKIFLASIGEGNELHGNLPVLLFEFRTKSLSADSTFQIAAVLADGSGNEIEVAPVQKVVSALNAESLQSILQAAQNMYELAEEGYFNGQYVLGAKAELLLVISVAQQTLNNQSATTVELQVAAEQLAEAMNVFQGKLINETTGDLTGAGGFSDGVISIADLGYVALHYGKSNQDMNWDDIRHADIDRNGTIDLYDLGFVARRIALH